MLYVSQNLGIETIKIPMASQRVKQQIAEGKAEQQRNWGGARKGAGPKKGVRVSIAQREKIRGAAIIERLHKITMGEVTSEPHHVTAGLGLLKFQLPTLTATDITSGGEKITIERVQFGQQNKT